MRSCNKRTRALAFQVLGVFFPLEFAQLWYHFPTSVSSGWIPAVAYWEPQDSADRWNDLLGDRPGARSQDLCQTRRLQNSALQCHEEGWKDQNLPRLNCRDFLTKDHWERWLERSFRFYHFQRRVRSISYSIKSKYLEETQDFYP